MLSKHFALDFFDQEGQVWVLETDARRWNTVVFDVWLNVFVVWMRAGQRWIVWMRLGIIPVQLLLAPRNQIAVALNYVSGKVQVFPNTQSYPLIKSNVACNFRKSWAMLDKNECGMTNDRPGAGQAVNKLLVFVEGRQHIKLFEVQGWELSVKRRLATSALALR